MPNTFSFILRVLLILTLSGVVSAAEEQLDDDFLLNPDDEKEDPESVSIVEKATEIVDEAQERVTERFNDFVIQVDGFFGDAHGRGRYRPCR